MSLMATAEPSGWPSMRWRTTVIAEYGVEIGDRGARPHEDRHLLRLVVDDARGRVNESCSRRELTPEFPASPSTFDGNQPLSADLGRKGFEYRIIDDQRRRTRCHPHTSFGTARNDWISAQLCPDGMTFPGLLRHPGSNACLSRF